ncbi:MAG: hypothetical protein ACYC3A_05685 [Halothiobacillus sp.]
MTILSTDIKLLASQRMTDTTDGGGRMTSTEIPDNVVGNLFEKISRLDGVYGRVNFRKLFLAVKSATLDIYGGANVGVIEPPTNGSVGVLLFSTKSDFDIRSDAQNSVESYVVQGVKSRMKLFGDQLVGQKAILVYQRTSDLLPEIGEVYLLSVEKTGYAAAQQFFRVGDMSYEDRSFTVGLGTTGGEITFTRRVIKLGIGVPLRQTYPGADITYVEDTGSPSIVRETDVADAAHYYGVQPVDGTFLAGALSVKAKSLFAPIVPSTNRETPISMSKINYALDFVQTGNIQNMGYIGASPPLINYLPRDVLSIAININNTWIGTIKYGELIKTNGTLTYALSADGPSLIVVGSNYVTIINSNGTPAVYVNQPPHTRQTTITLATQGTVYSEVFSPIPAPGTLIVDYRAQGRWYRLRDDGTGQLVDGSGGQTYGTGSLSYIDGSLVFTIAALPDVGSSILYSWGSPVHFLRLDAMPANPATPQFTFNLGPCVPGSVTITSSAGSSTDNGLGAFSGASVGNIVYATGAVSLNPPAPGDILSIVRSTVTSSVTVAEASIPATASGNTVTFTLPYPPTPRSFATSIALPGWGSVSVHDDGAGAIVGVLAGGSVSGTINYTTGAVSVTLTGAVLPAWTAGGVGVNSGWSSMPVTPQNQTVVIQFWKSTDTGVVQPALTLPAVTQVTYDLTRTTINSLVPNSLLFSTLGRQYYDKNGTLYNQFNNITGSGTPAGSIDYGTGIATITNWVANASTAVTLQAGLTKIGDFWVTESYFRTPGSPLRPASLYIQITTLDGRLLTGTADQNGLITGAEMTGQVQQDMGVVSVRYGKTVAGVWTPTQCLPDTLRFSCVVLTQLPLDPALLGLDPVRLPKDGRVPIYRPGDVVVLHSTKTDAAATLSASQVIQLSRYPVDIFSIRDVNGNRLPDADYTIDLPTGSVTMSATLNLAGVTAPFSLRHRQEEMALVSGVQIDGTLELSAQTKYDHDTTSFATSLMLIGDMQANYTNLFDQATWTSVWSDALIGSDAPAAYDDLNYPIEVLNDGAVTERWRINFTSSTAFQIVGEKLGIIATGTTAADIAVTNALIGKPYFTMRAAGFGIGWAAGNQIRFNTRGATAPIWAIRTILSGAPITGDMFGIERRGDIG